MFPSSIADNSSPPPSSSVLDNPNDSKKSDIKFSRIKDELIYIPR